MQRGENIACTDHVILGKIIVVVNSLDDIKTYERAKNEVKLVRPLYCLGLSENLTFIKFRGDEEEGLLIIVFQKISRKSYTPFKR